MTNLPKEHTLVVAIVSLKLDAEKSMQYLEILYYDNGKWFNRSVYPLNKNIKVIDWKYQDEVIDLIKGDKS